MKIAIYGAGNYASWFYKCIQLQKKEDQIAYFVVTSKSGNPETLFGKAVCAYEDVKEDLRTMHVWIGIGATSVPAVKEMLTADGITHVDIVTSQMRQMIEDEICKTFVKLPIQKNKIFVDCYEGLGYRCNCKYVVEELRKQRKDLEIIWSLSLGVPNDVPKEITTVTRNSPEFYQHLFTAHIGIFNDGVCPDLPRREGQYYICTWHGAGPFKKTHIDCDPGNEKLARWIAKMYGKVDLFVSSSSFNTKLLRSAFAYQGEVLEAGIPRMDCLLQENNFREKICDFYQIDRNQGIVLYAPTFRTNVETSFQSYDLQMKNVCSVLEERFHKKFVLLYRFHHQLYQQNACVDYYPEGVNATFYPDVQELLGAADVLITDYSSVMWDFSLQRKPVFLYHNDVETYMKDRGFYSRPEDWPYPRAHTEEEMLQVIREFDEKRYVSDVNVFFEKYGSFDDGHASERVVRRILEVMDC